MFFFGEKEFLFRIYKSSQHKSQIRRLLCGCGISNLLFHVKIVAAHISGVDMRQSHLVRTFAFLQLCTVFWLIDWRTKKSNEVLCTGYYTILVYLVFHGLIYGCVLIWPKSLECIGLLYWSITKTTSTTCVGLLTRLERVLFDWVPWMILKINTIIHLDLVWGTGQGLSYTFQSGRSQHVRCGRPWVLKDSCL